jgi:hypothetical protein
MGPPSYMRSVVNRNVVMRRIPVFPVFTVDYPPINSLTVGWTSGPPEVAVTHTHARARARTHTV